VGHPHLAADSSWRSGIRNVELSPQSGDVGKSHKLTLQFWMNPCKYYRHLLAGESPEGSSHPSIAARREAGSIADAAHPKRIVNGGRPSIASGEIPPRSKFFTMFWCQEWRAASIKWCCGQVPESSLPSEQGKGLDHETRLVILHSTSQQWGKIDDSSFYVSGSWDKIDDSSFYVPALGQD
jgi:hypothetical protein